MLKFVLASAPSSQHSIAKECLSSPSCGLQHNNNAPSPKVQRSNGSSSRSVHHSNGSQTYGLQRNGMTRRSIQQRSSSPTKRVSVKYVCTVILYFSILLPITVSDVSTLYEDKIKSSSRTAFKTWYYSVRKLHKLKVLENKIQGKGLE
jgi:ribosomal protein L44E